MMTFVKHQQTSQNNQLSMFSRKLAYMLAQITGDREWISEIWPRLHKHFSLPERARATNLLNEIIGVRLRNDHLESSV